IAVSALADENNQAVPEIFIITLADMAIKQLTNLEWNTVTTLQWTKDSAGLIAVAGERNADFQKQIWHVAVPTGEARKLLNDLRNELGRRQAKTTHSRKSPQ